MLFLVGRGRSGTTLISRMLSQHSSIHLAPEGFFILDLYTKYRRSKWSPNDIDQFCRDLVVEKRMQTWNLDLETLKRSLKEEQHPDYATMCRHVLWNEAVNSRSTPPPQDLILGDKNPHYSILTDQLYKVFPNTKFIHLIRDPRGTIASYKKVPFDRNTTTELALRWNLYNERIESIKQQIPEQFCTITHEQLLQEPGTVLRRICNHLGKEYEPGMLDYQEGGTKGFYGQDDPWFQGVNQALDPEKTKSWQKDLPPRDIQLANTICSKLGQKYGYFTGQEEKTQLTLKERKEMLTGRMITLAERILFKWFPRNWRIGIIHRHRGETGRI